MYGQHKLARMRAQTVFPQGDPLPGPECQLAIRDWNSQVIAGQNGADMGWHVVRAFHGMVE